MYGLRASTKAEFYSQHAKEGMVDAINKMCGQPGCQIRSSFGAPPAPR